MRVQFVDLGYQYEVIKDDVQASYAEIMPTSRFILGKEVGEFEAAFAEYCESKHGVGVASGLDALEIALRALDIGPGDEVITAANTFIATALAISLVGAKPVLVETDEASYNIDPANIEAAITPATKAIMPVHLYGQPADMDPINEIAKKHGLKVIEDASQSHGARYKGKRTGSMSDVACFSLYPGKNLGAFGDAGVIVTSDDDLAQRMRLLRNYGSSKKYHHEELGRNSRMATLQAAAVKAKLPHLDGWNSNRRRAAARYTEGLQGVGDLITPTAIDGVEHVYHLYVLRTKRRDELMARLNENDIDCIIHYPIPIHTQEAYSDMGWKEGDFPLTEQLCGEILSLPIYGSLSDEQVDHVVATVRGLWA